jgi:tRNA modification GTPase
LIRSSRASASANEVEAALSRAHQEHSVATLEVMAGEVGLALDALAQLTGEDASAALLDSIFARFCIGK